MASSSPSSSTTIVRTLTPAEAVAIARREPPFENAASRREKGGWHGASFDDACRMATDGDPESSALLLDVGISARIRSAMRPQLRWQESGSVVDVGRYLSGQPECMGEIVRAKRQSPVLRIAVERAASFDIGPETIRAIGGSVLTAIESLRSAGISTEIWATFTIGGHRRRNHDRRLYQPRVLVQEPGRPVDLHVLGFWLAHPAALRRIIFGLEEQETATLRQEFAIRERGGYGSPQADPLLAQSFDEVVPSTERKVEAWLNDLLVRRLGVTIDPKEVRR